MTLADIIPSQNGKYPKVYTELVDTSGDVIDTTNPLPITKGFNIPIYDYISLTYVAAGNGAGEIETVIFKINGSGGTTVATLTLTYNSDDEIVTVTQT